MTFHLPEMDSHKATLTCGLLGVLSTTVFFSMNTTINYLTIPTVFLGHPPLHSSEASASGFLVRSTEKPASAVSHLNRQWQEIYWRGHRVGPGSAIFSGIALGAASFFSSHGQAIKPGRWLLFAAAGAIAMSAYPYTVFAMVPTNDELHRRGDAITEGLAEKKDFDEGETAALLAKWVRLSKVRASLALIATAFGVAGLLW
ncbi:hypothetical protein PFICI_02321 [Pestalotiopsis fici W106-1]|uniref:Noranthrone monooxygenase n=1 Tax=Pestalotiopsis fici (strain W106-1 / CGMCC3.15140) TaxID=1229662 RepID=W3XGH4_PESFW|nr:uncharacterized protein PFICI_02321 [Pestalotiopsis fici W106-1]ETS84296.1 hypothetical protein PFICI_02321 [Pestalotiopsis fici W106-1]